MSQANGSERRSSDRQRTLLAGILIHGAAALTVDCAIRDLSKSGARVRLGAPDNFSKPLMFLVCRSGEAFEAEITWRRANDVGLTFLRQCNLSAAETPIERRPAASGSNAARVDGDELRL